MKEIATAEWNANHFTMIGKDDVLVAAERNGKVNAMTAGWGGLGVMWGKDVVFIVIRPSRYTKEFVDAGERFSVVHMGSDSKKLMTYMGTVSGRDEDKIAHEGLTLIPGEASPCFYEANVNIICKKLYAQEMRPDCMTDDGSIDERWYPAHDYHTLYIGEIEKILVK